MITHESHMYRMGRNVCRITLFESFLLLRRVPFLCDEYESMTEMNARRTRMDQPTVQ